MAVQENCGSRARRFRRRTRLAIARECRAPDSPGLPPALEGLFALISEPVLNLESSSDAQTRVREIGISLDEVLDLLEDDQNILRSADRLFDAALAFEDATRQQLTCAKITKRTVKQRAQAISVALVAFRKSLQCAKPNARARARRLAW